MNHRLQIALKQWLQSERGPSAAAAEEALRAVFSCLPVPPLPVGFADRILVRAGLSGRQAPVAWQPPFVGKAALAACLLLAALSTVLLPGTLQSISGLFGPAVLVELVTDAVVGAGQRLGEGLAVWRMLSDVGGILRHVFSSQTVLAALAFGALLSIGAFRLFYELIATERSSYNVRSA